MNAIKPFQMQCEIDKHTQLHVLMRFSIPIIPLSTWTWHNVNIFTAVSDDSIWFLAIWDLSHHQCTHTHTHIHVWMNQQHSNHFRSFFVVVVAVAHFALNTHNYVTVVCNDHKRARQTREDIFINADRDVEIMLNTTLTTKISWYKMQIWSALTIQIQSVFNTT